LDKGGFIGRDSLPARQSAVPRRRLVTLAIETTLASAPNGASQMGRGQVVGTITSEERGHRVGQNLALAFVRPDDETPCTTQPLDLCCTPVPARVIPPSPCDPVSTKVVGWTAGCEYPGD
jgi:dimethylglycine dehydrogenase